MLVKSMAFIFHFDVWMGNFDIVAYSSRCMHLIHHHSNDFNADQKMESVSISVSMARIHLNVTVASNFK